MVPLRIITQITHLIDLNTLHALSRTCRQIRANLLQYRTRLVRQTLRCSNEEEVAPPPVSSDGYHIANGEDHAAVMCTTECGVSRRNVGIGLGGGYFPCARDLVSECRRCEKVTCRVRIFLP